MAVNVHICGKIVEYETPKKRIIPENINKTKKATFVYTTKQERLMEYVYARAVKAKKLEDKIYLNSAETFTNHIHLCKEAINYLSDRIYQLENEKELTR